MAEINTRHPPVRNTLERIPSLRFGLVLMQKFIHFKNKFIHSSVPFCMTNKKISI
jgi:hypothetical protein